MPKFLSLLGLFLKYRLKSAAFWVGAAVLLLLFGSFALLCPVERPASAQIGLMYDTTDIPLQSACEPLLASDTLYFIYYPPEALPTMQQDVRTGVLHCAYHINPQNDPPITVYENEGAFLTSVTDELVFAAWFETQLPQTTLTIAEKLGLKDQQHIVAEMQRLQVQNSPLTLLLTLNASTAPQPADSSGLVPLLYAVLIPLFLLCCAFSAILAPSRERELMALLQLRCSARPWLPATASALAQVLLFAVLSTLCEVLLLLWGIDAGYAPAARLTLIVLLALLAALIVPIVSRFRPSAVLLLVMMLWAAVSVIFSGAIITPEALGSFSTLKYLSPPWYLLQLMTALS
ncbi:hypothetical protein ACS3UN_04780 [Oscillospiraceae bacterium LTW-04]|nr:ABC transporter permease [Oscillospiraceae bacterium MB24-C1]